MYNGVERHTCRRTIARAATKVGRDGRSHAASLTGSAGSGASWPARRMTIETRPSRAGVVRTIARTVDWRGGSRPPTHAARWLGPHGYEPSAQGRGRCPWRGSLHPGAVAGGRPRPCPAAPWERGGRPGGGATAEPLPHRTSHRGARHEARVAKPASGLSPCPVTRRCWGVCRGTSWPPPAGLEPDATRAS